MINKRKFPNIVWHTAYTQNYLDIGHSPKRLDYNNNIEFPHIR